MAVYTAESERVDYCYTWQGYMKWIKHNFSYKWQLSEGAKIKCGSVRVNEIIQDGRPHHVTHFGSLLLLKWIILVTIATSKFNLKVSFAQEEVVQS